MSLDAWYVWLTISSVVVLLGVTLEGYEFFSEIKKHRWKPIWPKLGFILLVVGLAGELFFQTKIESVDEKLKRESDQKVEVLRSDNLKLEQQIQPRRLTLEQEKSLASLFANFPGRTVRVSSYMQDIEGAVFGEQILRVAIDAGLPKPDDRRMYVSTYGGLTVGLVITGTETPMVEGATTLFEAFKFGPVTHHPILNWLDADETLFALKIFIGAKPLPISAP